MSADTLFCSLSSRRIADLIRSARQAVCYAAPGVQPDVAQAMLETGGRLGQEMLTVCLDFDERVMRMGYGEIAAVQRLLDAGVSVRSAPGLRTALVIVDQAGFIFTPTALYLEAEPTGSAAPNAPTRYACPASRLPKHWLGSHRPPRRLQWRRPKLLRRKDA